MTVTKTIMNKLAKLRRHASRIHFALIHFAKIHLETSIKAFIHLETSKPSYTFLSI